MRSLLLTTLILSGCSALDIGTAHQLMNTNPLTVDPAGYRIYANLPEGLELVQGSAKLRLATTRDTTEFAEEFLLNHKATLGEHELAIAPHDLDRFRQAQAKARAWEEADPDATQGSLSVGVGVCTRGGGPDPSAPVSIDIALGNAAGSAGRLPLMHALPAARYLKELEKQSGEPVQACGS